MKKGKSIHGTVLLFSYLEEDEAVQGDEGVVDVVGG